MKTILLILLTFCIFSCKDKSQMEVQEAKQVSIDSMKIEIQKQKIIDSMNVEMEKIKEEKQQKEVVYSNQNVTPATAPPAKKKGWSGAAKGAVIGAGVGAITGAVVSEEKGQGAIIGGLAGAGVGAGAGAIIDSKKKD